MHFYTFLSWRRAVQLAAVARLGRVCSLVGATAGRAHGEIGSDWLAGPESAANRSILCDGVPSSATLACTSDQFISGLDPVKRSRHDRSRQTQRCAANQLVGVSGI